MLFDGKAIHLSKGDSFTFYEHEVSIKEPGNYVRTAQQPDKDSNINNTFIFQFQGTSQRIVWKCAGWRQNLRR